MAHYTRIDGSYYEIAGGATRVDGFVYDIPNGRTLVNGIGYGIDLSSAARIELTSSITDSSGMGVFSFPSDVGVVYTQNNTPYSILPVVGRKVTVDNIEHGTPMYVHVGFSVCNSVSCEINGVSVNVEQYDPNVEFIYGSYFRYHLNCPSVDVVKIHLDRNLTIFESMFGGTMFYDSVRISITY